VLIDVEADELADLERFSSLVTKYQETPEMARMIARACYRAK